MSNLTTNLALLMEWVRITPKELNRALGVDLSLISRWRTGSRRLSAGSRWCGRLTEYFLQVRRDEVTALMARVSPLGLAQGQSAEELLERWLGESAGPWENWGELLFLSRNQDEGMRKNRRLLDAGPLSGDRAVRKLLMEFLDDALVQPGPGEIVFFCSEGLEFFTRDERYVQVLQEKLQALFRRGKRIQAVLRTNYRPSDVALAWGPWLRAHLTGHIQSCYYDDFRLLEHEEILFGLRGRLMVQIRMKNGIPQAAIHQRPEAISKAEACFDDRAQCARPRFVYRFFRARGTTFAVCHPKGRIRYMCWQGCLILGAILRPSPGICACGRRKPRFFSINFGRWCPPRGMETVTGRRAKSSARTTLMRRWMVHGISAALSARSAADGSISVRGDWRRS